MYYLVLLFVVFSGCSKKNEITVYDVPKEGAKAIALAPAKASDGMKAGGVPGLEQSTQGFAIPKWKAPIDWEAQPLGSMRKGSFIVKNSKGESADISILVFPGDVGGFLANVNRWRQQIGLEGISMAELNEFEAIEVSGEAGVLVDCENTATEVGVFGVMVPHAGATWYFKMSGNRQVVLEQKMQFREFLKTVSF